MADLELKALNSFIGTQQYHSFYMGTLLTDGAKYIAENGYSWLLTDAVSVIKTTPRIRKEPFLVIQLTNLKNYECDLIISDGNDNILHKQHYNFTDAQREFTLYFSEDILMLSSEY